MDLQNETVGLFAVLGENVAVNGCQMVGLVDFSAEPETGPWPGVEGAQPAPQLILRQGDLKEYGLWPLDNPTVSLTRGGQNHPRDWRVIASVCANGLVELWLQEAG